MENKLVNEILSIKRDNINGLLSLTESPIERLFLLHLIKYLELQLVQNEFTTASFIDGFHYLTEANLNKKSSLDKITGLCITYSVVGFEANIDLTKYGINGEEDYTKRQPFKIKSEIDDSKFTKMQWLLVIPQYKLKIENQSYRLDFAFLLYENIEHNMKLVKKIGIECDGYDYHSNKDQFKKDRERLRKLETERWHILHFSGSEINSFQYDNDAFMKAIIKIFRLLAFSSHNY